MTCDATGRSAVDPRSPARPVVPAEPSTCTDLAVRDELGPLGPLAKLAHGYYVDGLPAGAVDACCAWMAVTRLLGADATTRYLLYIEAISLLDLGRYSEALEISSALFDSLGERAEPVWRCKSLSVIAEATVRMDKISEAIAPLAEADWQLGSIEEGSYGHLSASMALGLALRSANLLERADVILRGLFSGDDPELETLVTQEAALLSAHWGSVLTLIDRHEDAALQYRRTAERAVRMQHFARLADNPTMVARGAVIETFGLMRLGEPDLAVARARGAASSFAARPELIETHLLHLVMGSGAGGVSLADARDHLWAVIADATACRRGAWVGAGRVALAELDALVNGASEGSLMWRELAQTALRSVWAEREARFAALRDQEAIRLLTAEAHRYGQVMLEDPLTGLGNRRMLTRIAQGEDRPQSVIFVDVDHFKTVNDRYSHAVGDVVLRTVADLLRRESRAEDRLLRYGGDEFVVLPGGGPTAASVIAHRIREAVQSYPWDRLAPGLAVTVSVGVGEAGDATDSTSVGDGDLLHVADRAMLSAKRSGRNRVVHADAG